MRSWSMVVVMCFFGFTANPPAACGQAIEMEINHTPAENDDYIGWTPVRGQIRQLNGTVDLVVTLESTKADPTLKNGEVSFAAFTIAPPKPSTWTPQDTLTVTLPADGTWKGFWVAGTVASTNGKDVKILVKKAGNVVINEHPLMVRVRKNAESLTDVERDRFLAALAGMHDLNNPAGVGKNSKYLKYVKAHLEAFYSGIHNNPGFTPWHRAMVLSFERELQSFDPRVALPYWKFDQPAPKLFSRKFLGVVTATSAQVQFDATNPIQKWAMPTVTQMAAMPNLTTIPVSTDKMVRALNADTTPPDVDFDSVLDTENHTLMRNMLEGNYHNEAHNHIGGWLLTEASPRDPLFFLLHANVDRAWAVWQKDKNRFDPDGLDALSYSPLSRSWPGQPTLSCCKTGNKR